MNQVAYYFGKDATYDAVEGQLRKAKGQAKDLQKEAEAGPGLKATPSRIKKTKKVNDSPLKTRE